MEEAWMNVSPVKVKRCAKCKSKRLKPITAKGTVKDGGHTLIQRIPALKCKDCGQVHTGMHHLIMNHVLEIWVEEGPGGHKGETAH